jgi:hypothetical protein
VAATREHRVVSMKYRVGGLRRNVNTRHNYGLQRTAGAHVRDKRTATSARRR